MFHHVFALRCDNMQETVFKTFDPLVYTTYVKCLLQMVRKNGFLYLGKVDFKNTTKDVVAVLKEAFPHAKVLHNVLGGHGENNGRVVVIQKHDNEDFDFELAEDLFLGIQEESQTLSP